LSLILSGIDGEGHSLSAVTLLLAVEPERSGHGDLHSHLWGWGDGVVDVGHRYDEYVDVTRYYFVKIAGGQPQSISLKKSALKKNFEGEADSFIAAQGSRDIDEDYLREMGNSLSK